MSRGLPVVVLENAAEPFLAADIPAADRPGANRRLPADGCGEADGRVRPLPVVVADVLAQKMVQVPRAEDDEVVQALDLDALDEPLDVSIQIGRAVRQPNGLDPGPGQCRAKGRADPKGRSLRLDDWPRFGAAGDQPWSGSCHRSRVNRRLSVNPSG